MIRALVLGAAAFALSAGTASSQALYPSNGYTHPAPLYDYAGPASATPNGYGPLIYTPRLYIPTPAFPAPPAEPGYYTAQSVVVSQPSRRGLGIVEPCLPSPAKVPPSGPGWIHEIKHDGFRILARKDAADVRLITRAGNDFSDRFPFIATAVAELRVRSCLIDGEAIICDENGLAVFELIRGHGAGEHAVLSAFDLLELDGEDLRRKPIETRKALLAKLLERSHLSLVLNEHYEGDGALVFREACRLGCEGIVSKKLGSIYRRGRSPLWLKVKNPNAPAVKREAEEDWGR